MQNGEAGFELRCDPKGRVHIPLTRLPLERLPLAWLFGIQRRLPSPNQKDGIIMPLGQLPVEAPKNPLKKPILWGPLRKLPFERKRKKEHLWPQNFYEQ